MSAFNAPLTEESTGTFSPPSFHFYTNLFNHLHMLQPTFYDHHVVVPCKQYVALENRAYHIPCPGEPIVRHEEMPDVRYGTGARVLEIGRTDPGVRVEEDELAGLAEADDLGNAASE
jgi:hypothetical protein